MEPIKLSTLWIILHRLQQNGCTYKLGAKAPAVMCDTSQVHSIDCSGFVRFAIAKATDGKVIFPDGSFTQHDFCKAQGLHVVDYNNAVNPEFNKGRLFIAFEDPNPVGHVWLINEGHTLESSGHVGPNSRDANTPMFHSICSGCYELICVP